jgi:hypothetical protein
VRLGSIQGQTLSLCLLLAGMVFVGSELAGRAPVGMGLAVGVVIGSFNGFTLQAVVDRRAPILATSIVRLALFSLLSIAAARLLGGSIWSVVLGVGLAQLVMVVVGARQGFRA